MTDWLMMYKGFDRQLHIGTAKFCRDGDSNQCVAVINDASIRLFVKWFRDWINHAEKRCGAGFSNHNACLGYFDAFQCGSECPISNWFGIRPSNMVSSLAGGN